MTIDRAAFRRAVLDVIGPSAPSARFKLFGMVCSTWVVREARGLCDVQPKFPPLEEIRSNQAVPVLSEAKRLRTRLLKQAERFPYASQDTTEATKIYCEEFSLDRELRFGEPDLEQRIGRMRAALRLLPKTVDVPAVCRTVFVARKWACGLLSNGAELDRIREGQEERDQIRVNLLEWLDRLNRLCEPEVGPSKFVITFDGAMKARELLTDLQRVLREDKLFSGVSWVASSVDAGSVGPHWSDGTPLGQDPTHDLVQADGARIFDAGTLVVPRQYELRASDSARRPLRRPRRGPATRPWVRKARSDLARAKVPPEQRDEFLIVTGLLIDRPNFLRKEK